MEKLNLNKIIGYILLSPALLSVVLFFYDFIASFFRANNHLLIHHLFAKMSPQWHGYGSPHTSALPFYFGLMAIAGALLVINSTKKEIKWSMFYNALEINYSAVEIMDDDNLRTIARELWKSVRNSTTIDWTIKESVQATLRRNIRRILRKYGYPPDKQEKAIQTVIEQVKLLAEELA